MPIVYENPKDNPKREAKLREYLDFLATSNNLDKSGYEAYFFIGKFCTTNLTTTEQEIFLETKVVQMFIRTLESLFEKREEFKFDESTNVEVGDAPKSDEINFKESIFSYTLFSFNILCKDLVRDYVIRYRVVPVNLNLLFVRGIPQTWPDLPWMPIIWNDLASRFFEDLLEDYLRIF